MSKTTDLAPTGGHSSFLERYGATDLTKAKDASFKDLEVEFGDEAFDAADLGEGFTVISSADKKKLVGLPFFILGWRRNANGRNGEFVSVKILTRTDERVIFNDGSTGINKQLSDMEKDDAMEFSTNERGEFVPAKPIICRKGLRVSEYDVEDESGNKITDPATGKVMTGRTFYIDTTK